MPKNLYYDDVKVIKKPLKKRIKSIFIFFLVIIVMVACFFVSTYFSEALTVGNISSFLIYGGSDIKINSVTYYLVTLGEYGDQKEAESVALGSALQGASGYVWQGDKYYVVGNVYYNLEDASSVKENLKNTNYDINVLNIEFPKLNLNFKDEYENSEIKKIREALEIFDTVCKSFYDDSISFDKSEINNVVVSSNSSNLRSEVKVLISNMQNLLKTQNAKVQTIQNGLIRLDELLNQTTLATIENNNINYKIKNTLLKALRIKYETYLSLSDI